MKLVIISICFAVFANSYCQSEDSKSGGAVSASISISNHLFETIRSADPERISLEMKQIAEGGNPEVVAAALGNKVDNVKQIAAMSLLECKGKGIAEKILANYRLLDLATMGGTEATITREKTKAVFELVLSKMTGVKIEKNWSFVQKAEAFKEGVNGLPGN